MGVLIERADGTHFKAYMKIRNISMDSIELFLESWGQQSPNL